jgi:hypothetical protein
MEYEIENLVTAEEVVESVVNKVEPPIDFTKK